MDGDADSNGGFISGGRRLHGTEESHEDTGDVHVSLLTTWVFKSPLNTFDRKHRSTFNIIIPQN